MKTNYDVVVIGAGVIGTMTAKALAERGRHTLILERYQLGHKGGSSHGLSRIVRVTDYHPDYVRLNRLAMRGWEELQEAAGETLLVRTGNLEIGEGARLYADALDAAGERYGWLAPEAARERWPSLRLRADEPMFVQEDGGVCLADRTVRAAARLATKAGAELREGTRVERISNHDTFAEVVTEGRDDPRAGRRRDGRRLGAGPPRRCGSGPAAGPHARAGVLLPAGRPLRRCRRSSTTRSTERSTTTRSPIQRRWGASSLAWTTPARSSTPTRGRSIRTRSASHGRRPGAGSRFRSMIPTEATRDLSLHEHAGQRLRPGPCRVGRRRLGLQRARLQGEPVGRHDPGRPGDGLRAPASRSAGSSPPGPRSIRSGPIARLRVVPLRSANGPDPARVRPVRPRVPSRALLALTSLHPVDQAGTHEVGEMVGFCRSPGMRARW